MLNSCYTLIVRRNSHVSNTKRIWKDTKGYFWNKFYNYSIINENLLFECNSLVFINLGLLFLIQRLGGSISFHKGNIVTIASKDFIGFRPHRPQISKNEFRLMAFAHATSYKNVKSAAWRCLNLFFHRRKVCEGEEVCEGTVGQDVI